MFFCCRRKASKSSHLFIKDMMVEMAIGVNDDERGRLQPVRINVIIIPKHWPNAGTDNINDTVSYDLIVKHVFDLIKDRHFNLVETFAEEIAARCLREDIKQVNVRVEKMGIYSFAIPGVDITREK